ncbi:MAG TPA: mannosyltransferase family protein [Acidimicrobiales bacterium]|nr:mannosyltransferase family protein [Acidimicrobiales bacterium]
MRELAGKLPRDLRAALPAWALARVAVALGALVAIVVSDELLAGVRPLQLEQGLFAWDAAFYRDIADHGYEGVAREALRFFPLVPLLAALLAVPLLGNVGVALILVANMAALAAGALLHRLARTETGDTDLAGRAAWHLALLPPALVLVLGYAESVMLALSIATFLALRRQRWWSAAIFGFLSALSRPLGAALALPAAIEGARGLREATPGERVARLGAVVGPVAGLFSYLVWVQVRFGDWRFPVELHASEELRGGFVNPVVRIFQSGAALLGDGTFGDGLHLPWIVLFLGLLVVCFRTLPVSYGAYAAVLLAAALSAESLGSFERYGLAAFPLVLGLAIVTRPAWLDRLAVTSAAAGLVAFTTMALLGTFVP